MAAIELTPAAVDTARSALPPAIMRDWVALADNRRSFRIIGALPDGSILVRGEQRHSALARVVRTGERARGSQGLMRGKITWAQDHGHADGRVTFDGETIGCRVPAIVWQAALRARP